MPINTDAINNKGMSKMLFNKFDKDNVVALLKEKLFLLYSSEYSGQRATSGRRIRPYKTRSQYLFGNTNILTTNIVKKNVIE